MQRQFEPVSQNVVDILQRIKTSWETDYSWVTIEITNREDVCFYLSEDVLQVVFDTNICKGNKRIRSVE